MWAGNTPSSNTLNDPSRTLPPPPLLLKAKLEPPVPSICMLKLRLLSSARRTAGTALTTRLSSSRELPPLLLSSPQEAALPESPKEGGEGAAYP